MGSGGKANVLLLHIKFKAPIATVAANAAGLDATKGRGQVPDVFAIHPDHACLKLVCKTERAGEVIGPQIGGESVGRVICNLQGLLFTGEGNGGENRAKNFFLGNAHGVMRPGEEGWADEISGIPKNLAASGHFGSVLCCDIEIGGDFGEMLFADQRADFSGGIQRVANLYGV